MISKHQFGGLHKALMATPGVEGGFTTHAVTGETPTSGHMVAYDGTEDMIKPAGATKPSHLAGYVNKNRDALAKPDNYLGGWKPSGDEFTTLDVSQRVAADPKIAARHGHAVADADARTSALDIGISRNQFATFDLSRGVSTPTNIDRQV